jgi:multidrug efflux pump subunit AcrA (membrane-fusion protein)
MFGQNAVSRDVYESAEMTVRTTRAQIAALDAQIISGGVKVETARANLGYTRVTAPVAGTVLAVVTLEGQTVNAVQSAPTIVVLGDVSTMTTRSSSSPTTCRSRRGPSASSSSATAASSPTGAHDRRPLPPHLRRPRSRVAVRGGRRSAVCGRLSAWRC